MGVPGVLIHLDLLIVPVPGHAGIGPGHRDRVVKSGGLGLGHAADHVQGGGAIPANHQHQHRGPVGKAQGVGVGRPVIAGPGVGGGFDLTVARFVLKIVDIKDAAGQGAGQTGHRTGQMFQIGRVSLVSQGGVQLGVVAVEVLVVDRVGGEPLAQIVVCGLIRCVHSQIPPCLGWGLGFPLEGGSCHPSG